MKSYLNLQHVIIFVSPGEYGIPRPWYFIFQINYWGGVPLEAGMPIPEAPTQQNGGKGFQNPLCIICYVYVTIIFQVHSKSPILVVNPFMSG